MNVDHFSVMSAFNFRLGDGDICIKERKICDGKTTALSHDMKITVNFMRRIEALKSMLEFLETLAVFTLVQLQLNLYTSKLL